ncbi:MAG: hydroxymethylbilane synthase [Cytophagales bacterium]|nr:hydroxymethylbilane synthase [Cytophagales bacterium]
MKINIGTRGSKLALWQAYYIEEILQAGGLETEIVIIETKGDKILDKALSKIGSKGVFTEELESALREERIDIAVHSAKDLQSSLDEDLPIIAFTEREQVNDVLVSYQSEIDLSKEMVIGTSSTRRVALLKHYYPQLKIVDMRGNLQTRFQKLKDGACDAMVLAFAGVHRMELDSHIVHHFPTDNFVPPVGQGTVAIQSSLTCSDEKRERIRGLCNVPTTEYCLLAERAYLRKLDGGCSIPVFGNAVLEGDNVKLVGGIVSLDGQELLKEELTRDKNEAEELGKELAQIISDKGGKRILEDIRKAL